MEVGGARVELGRQTSTASQDLHASRSGRCLSYGWVVGPDDWDCIAVHCTEAQVLRGVHLYWPGECPVISSDSSAAAHDHHHSEVSEAAPAALQPDGAQVAAGAEESKESEQANSSEPGGPTAVDGASGTTAQPEGERHSTSVRRAESQWTGRHWAHIVVGPGQQLQQAQLDRETAEIEKRSKGAAEKPKSSWDSVSSVTCSCMADATTSRVLDEGRARELALRLPADA